MTDEDVQFEVALAAGDTTNVFDSLVSLDEWSESHSSDACVTLVVAIQPRDPSRRYEALGAPKVAVVQLPIATDAHRRSSASRPSTRCPRAASRTCSASSRSHRGPRRRAPSAMSGGVLVDNTNRN
uniref:Uncharacterized protein n=1 Tax=Oryza nivara TaxID=4536 RepID=A0A0E0J8P1_ORYNI